MLRLRSSRAACFRPSRSIVIRVNAGKSQGQSQDGQQQQAEGSRRRLPTGGAKRGGRGRKPAGGRTGQGSPPDWKRGSRMAPQSAPDKPIGPPLEAVGTWRVFGIKVSLQDDPGKDDHGVHPALLEALRARLGTRTALRPSDASVVRKSFDARRRPPSFDLSFTYVVDVDAAAAAAAGARFTSERINWLERAPENDQPFNVHRSLEAARLASWPSPSPTVAPVAPVAPVPVAAPPPPPSPPPSRSTTRAPVVVVGAGPAGLFAALTLAEAGLPVVLLERGQPVETRGRDIGALFARSRLDPDSNLCYGEGGAGTWSDGKLTTRIGRNSDPVRRVLSVLHAFGAPDSVLVAGKPHLGTDRLVRILKAFRGHLRALGAEVRFGEAVERLTLRGGAAVGVELKGGEVLPASAVVLAVGHSARGLYRCLLDQGVTLTPKPFALGFRVEHPQAWLDAVRYGAEDAQGVMRGKGVLPVADYTLATQVMEGSALRGAGARGGAARRPSAPQDGVAPLQRGVYSFCMCPGGQVVPTSTVEDELCVNGMSFSKRNSEWANAALVVSVQPSDWSHLVAEHGPLAGVALQVEAEREAARRGGGRLVAPVQRVDDFLSASTSDPSSLPSSSYRLGVRSAPLHDLYAPPITRAIAEALGAFERQLPGFVSGGHGLLHGVETRTSAPVRIDRREDDCCSVACERLYPCGEGAGYAGGIVSAAVDGLRVGEAVLRDLTGGRGTAGATTDGGGELARQAQEWAAAAG